MNNPKRDLLLMFNDGSMTQKDIEQEVELLHVLLYDVERIENLVIAHELIDLNKYRLINKPAPLRNFFRRRNLKPFEFLNCKN